MDRQKSLHNNAKTKVKATQKADFNISGIRDIDHNHSIKDSDDGVKKKNFLDYLNKVQKGNNAKKGGEDGKRKD